MRWTRWLGPALLLIAAGCGGDDKPPAIALRPKPDAGALQMVVDDTQRCEVAAIIDEHKACQRDADCTVLSYRPTCCANLLVVGVARENVADVRTCAEHAPPKCACDARPDRAEDGRVADLSAGNAMVTCNEGRCQSRVTTRPCGASKVCDDGELCIVYGNVASDADAGASQPADPGDNAYLTYACVANPCADTLDCTCAQASCDAKADADRKCEIALVTDADVSCVPYRD